MIIYYHVAVVLVWLNTVVKQLGLQDQKLECDFSLDA